MATNLSTIFGPEINVGVQPRLTERSFHGFPGAHGVTTMFLGSRGREVRITGRIVTAGAGYDAARVSCQVAIDAIEAWLFAPAADYSWGSCVYYAVVWEDFRLLPDGEGKFFSWLAGGKVAVDFVCIGRTLI